VIYLVVPCFNEAHRLPVDKFLNYQSSDVRFLFVNDGSKDQTLSVIKELCSKINAEYLSFDMNQGKAEVVRQGVLFLLQNKKLNDEDWLGFWDADLATPLSEVQNFIKFERLYSEQKVDGIWGSRVYRLGAVIRRSAKRHYISRIFATLMYYLFQIQSYDSQCGAKMFKPRLAREIFQSAFVSRWIFDVEMLIGSKNANIIEYPVQEWIDVEGSKITFKETFRILKDIFRVYLGSK